MATSTTPEKSKKILKGLYESHAAFTDSIEALYVSLNFYDSHPDLKNANLEFIRTLLLARDLKINIRKRAIGSFFEWDRLDQAVGGRNQALGTCLLRLKRVRPAFLSLARYEAPSADPKGYFKAGACSCVVDQEI